MISSLQTRLLLTVSMVAVAAVVAVALSARQWTRVEFRRFQERQHERSLERRAPPDVAAITSVLDGRCCSSEAMDRAASSLGAREAILVLDEGGRLIATAGPGAAGLEQVSTRIEAEEMYVEAMRNRAGVSESVELRFKGEAAWITTVDGRRAQVHVVPLPPADLPAPAEVFLVSVDRRLLAATALVGALAIAVTWVLARRIVRPIGELGAAARDLSAGNLSRRVDPCGSDEIGRLAVSFNAMASELERQHMLRRDLVHDVAHELRTPLTALRCRLETVRDGLAGDPVRALAGAAEEVGHLSRLVDDLQEVAKAEARELLLTFERVPIAHVARSALAAAGLEGDARVTFEIDPSLTVRGDAVRLRQVLLNLLTNAARHTPAGGTIAVRAARVNGDVAISVRNTGSTLTAGQAARVFDRFYRGDPARQRATGGTGLGLAIVKHLVEAHGGRVDASSGPDGVTFTVRLPSGPDGDAAA